MRAAIRRHLEARNAPPVAVDPTERLLTPDEVAEVLSVSASTVKRTFRRREGTVFLTQSRYARMRIPQAVLKRYIEEGPLI